nr:succinate dehydrogenase, hydrophobic membrane anchor protein [Mesorhizobium sp. B2-4-17]
MLGSIVCYPLHSRNEVHMKEGARHWWRERLSAVALIPLTLWFLASIVAHSASDYVAFVGWLRSPISAAMMVLLLVASFYHTGLGLQVIIEDYVHSPGKSAIIAMMRLGCVVLAAAGCLAVGSIVLGQ